MKDDFEPINDYILGLGMFAKTDIHLRFETQIFYQFFISIQKKLFRKMKQEDFDLKEVGFSQIQQVISDRTEFDKTIALELKCNLIMDNLPNQ